MATRYIDKVASLAELRNLPDAGGVGIYQGRVYMNLNGNVVPLAVAPAFGNVILVDGDHGSATDTRLPYSTIQLGVAAAAHGDTVLIRALDSDTAGISAGTAADPPGYVGDVTISPGQENISLIGIGGGLSQMSQPCIRVGATTTNPLITVQAVGVAISNLTINGSAGTGGGIKLDAVASTSDAGGLVVSGCIFKGCKGATAPTTRGGAIWASGGGSWYVTIANNDFYGCRVGIALIGSSSVSVPKCWKILNNRFFGTSAETDCCIDLTAAGADGINGLVIDSCLFGVVDVPTYATGTGYKSRYLDLTGCTNGILSNCVFAAIAEGTGVVTFKAAGTAAYVPTTVRIVNCTGECYTDATLKTGVFYRIA